MHRVQGNPDAALIECTNPIKNKWRVRWDVTLLPDGTASYMEEECDRLPEPGEIRQLIATWVNDRTNAAILSGFVYEGNPVWLSTENQFNYKAAYDLAVQTAGASLPVTFKLGTDEEPVYREFADIDSLKDFYTAAMAHIQKVLADGWRAKDNFDSEKYRVD